MCCVSKYYVTNSVLITLIYVLIVNWFLVESIENQDGNFIKSLFPKMWALGTDTAIVLTDTGSSRAKSPTVYEKKICDHSDDYIVGFTFFIWIFKRNTKQKLTFCLVPIPFYRFQKLISALQFSYFLGI